MQRIKRFLSLILVLIMLANMMPVSTYATELQSNDIESSEESPLEKVEQSEFIVEEVIENRTEFSKDFRMSNGLHVAAVYSNAVHFQRDGQWEDIDNTLTLAETRSGNGYTNTAANWQVFFPEKLTDGKSVSVSKDSFTLRFSIVGELKSPGGEDAKLSDVQLSSDASSDPDVLSRDKNVLAQQVVSQSEVHPANEATAEVVPTDVNTFKEASKYQEAVIEKLTSRLLYEDIYANTDIVYDLGPTQLKESIIMQQYDADLHGYSYLLDTGEMIPVLNEDNEIVLYGEDSEEPVMRMPAPYLFDEAGSYCYDVMVVLEESDEGYILSYVLPREWLSDENRQWPVTLDPIVDTIASNTNAEDQIVYENPQFSSPANANVLNVGYDTTCYSMRTYMRYNALPPLTSADVIVNASIELYCTDEEGDDTTVEVREVLGNWSAGSITWSNQPAYSPYVKDFVITKSAHNYYTWDITDIVRSWYTGSNYGMVFKATDLQEAARKHSFLRYYSADFTSVCKPTLTITYRNNNGLERYWDYTVTSAGRAGTGYINQYTGNLVWIRDAIGYGGTRMPVNISLVYNANDTAHNTFGVGYGWRTNYHQRVYQFSENSEYYIWEDSDGTKHYFKYSTPSTYMDEDGLELTLTTGNSGSYPFCITDKYGNRSWFDDKGRLIEIWNNQESKSIIQISYANISDYYINQIIDGAGRKYNFTYSGSNLSAIKYTGTISSTITSVRFSHDASHLISVTDKDGAVTSYTYGEKHLLTSAQDVGGYKLAYEYTIVTPGLPSRVQKVTETDGTTSGGVLNISYAQNQTTFTDVSGNVEIIQFNNWGNTISIQDGLGRAQYAKYSTDDNSVGKGNQLILSSKLQNTIVNLLNDSSFESSTSWLPNNSVISSSITTETAYLGSNSLKIVRSDTGAQAGVYGANIQVAAGETYTFSAYVKTGAAPAYLVLWDGSRQERTDALPAYSDWTRLEVSYTATETAILTPHLLTANAGTVYMDCVQMEKGPTASRYNLVQNGDFRTTGFWSSMSGRISGLAAVPQMDGTVYAITGRPGVVQEVTQNIPVSGSVGDDFVLAGWGKATSVPLNNSSREFAIKAIFNNTDGTKTTHIAQFNPYIGVTLNWQYTAVRIEADKPYSSITVCLAYNDNANDAYFDGIQLYKEEFGNQYSYDDNGNLTQARDLQGQETQYTYNGSNLMSTTLPSGGTLNYTYDDYHNVLTATTNTGIVYSYAYDTYGNNISVSIGSGSAKITSYAVYESDGNRLKSTTDAVGNQTIYNYDVNTNVLISVQYPKDTGTTKTAYDYDSMSRLVSAATTTDSGLNLRANYKFTNDLLTKITTSSTTYNFSYGSFDLRSSIAVGSQNLATYTYTDHTNYLKKLAYGNGDSVEYIYDQQGRVTQQTYYEDHSTTPDTTVTYKYDSNGALGALTDSGTGITTNYYYDTSGRLLKYSNTGAHNYTADYRYDSNDNLTQMIDTILGSVYQTYYYYDTLNRVSRVYDGGVVETYTYDGFNRLSGKVARLGDAVLVTDTFTYREGGGGTSSQVATMSTKYGGHNVTYTYSYDGNGNIVSISNGTHTTSYAYDTANQLIRENNQAAGKTWVWTYNNGGNITSRKEYAYTTGTLGAVQTTVNYSYGNTSWGDLLTSYNGQSIESDAIGNMTNDGTWSYTWERGRQLASMTSGSTTWSYTYNNDGMRVKRTNGSTTYTYFYNGNLLRYLDINGTKLYFVLDANGQPLEVSYQPAGTPGIQIYYYVMNLQGDVTAIVDTSGNPVVQYSYDAWGNILSITGTMASTLGTQNPFRYRGYVYDDETGLYYLQSRYYDPATGRFLNSDVAVSTSQGFVGNNMFAYCGNNPVARIDESGTAFETAWDLFSLGSSIWNVAMNPSDPWAWIGLAGDVIDVALPFVGGVGESTRAMKAVSQTAEMIDTASDAKKGWRVGEDITKLTKAGNVPSWSTIRSRYWKNKAHYFEADYSKSDFDRMKKGLAPLVEYVDGKKYPMELHHPNGRKGENIFTFIEVTPWKHAEIDAFRHF